MFLDKILDFSALTDSKAEKVYKIKVNGKVKYISLLCVSGIDIFHYSNQDMESVFNNFAKATITLRLPHKYVFANSSKDFGVQLDFLKYKYSKTVHSYSKAMLKSKIEEIEYFQENHRDRMAYLIIFGDNEHDVKESYTRYKSEMTDTNVSVCTLSEAAEFFNRYLCFNSDRTSKYDNHRFNENILPDNIRFMPNCFKSEDTYATSIVVSEYPAYVSDLELANLVSSYPETIITLDVMQRPKKLVLDEIDRSLNELRSRNAVKQSTSEEMETADEFNTLKQIYADLSRGREQMFYATLRFIVSADSIKALQKKVTDIAEELEGRGFNCFVPINEMKSEYAGLVSENNTVQIPYPLFDSYARQYPFYYQSHCDPKGMFFGYTDTGGLNVLNTFYRNTSVGRNSYDMLITGLKGGGKSATLRAMLEDELILGNKVMVLDIESEYNEIARMYGGQVVKMNQRSIINTLQLRMTIDVDTENIDTDTEDMIDYKDVLEINFTSEISRICTFMYQFAPTITAEEMSDLQDIIIDTFRKKGITNKTDITKLPPQAFPIFSDLFDNIHSRREKAVSDFELQTLKKLEVMIKPLTKHGAYGTMFDNYTNVNINDNNFIVFNVQSISELDAHVYNACMFNILSIMWAEICKNREKNKQIINEFDRRYVVCLIDEAHRFISTKYPQVIEFIEKLLRRTRKYDAALWFASQSIIDFMSSDDSEEAKTIKVLFQLVQYKCIMLQDSDSVKILKEVFGQFTLSELQASTAFCAGEMLISLSSGRHKLHCRRQISPASMLYCGNAQDRNEIIHKIFGRLYNEYSYAEYGKMLMNNEQAQNEFVIIFKSEVFEYLGFKQTDSEYLNYVVSQMVENMLKELLYAAKEDSFEKY